MEDTHPLVIQEMELSFHVVERGGIIVKVVWAWMEEEVGRDLSICFLECRVEL